MLCIPKSNFSFQPKPAPFKLRTVVIDAGHGGHDPGAIGTSSTREKTVALAVALQVGEYIEKNYPDVKVIYTRKTDVFVELHERAAIANRNGADLFISIHCNTFDVSSVHGTEVYVLGLHKEEDNLTVAKRENSVISMETNYNAHYDGFDPKAPETHILMSLMQDAYIKQSNNFAILVDNQFKNRVSRTSRGVRQAGFLVLWKTAMPSTLIELGFISNKTEESYLTSKDGQMYMASAIYRAFKDYKTSFENKAPEPAPVSEDSSQPNVEETTPPPAPTPTPTPTPTPKPTPTEVTPAKTKVSFSVQFLSSSTELPKTDPRLQKVGDVQVVKVGNVFKYYSGSFPDFDSAKAHQTKVRSLGFKDAFMIAFVDGKKTTIQEAISALKK